MGMESIFALSVVMDLVDHLSGPAGQASKNVSASLQGMDEAFGRVARSGEQIAGLGTAILGAGASLVSATFDTQTALGELASLGVQDLQAISDAAAEFSGTWAGTTKDQFISASYDIKSGIASLTDEGVAQFTELAGLTATATKSTTDTMTSLFATSYGIYKGFYSDMSDLEFGEMFSAGLATAVKNYKTSGSEMASAISALGATATSAGASMEEQLAILGQLQATMSGSEAATKYRAFLTQAASAGEKLGLSFTDSNGQLLGTADILEALQGKYGDTIDAIEKQQIKEAFGTDEAVAMIDLLYGKTDTLRGGIDDLAASMAAGTDVTKEMADAINDTPANQLAVLKQEAHNVAEELGGSLLPVATEAMGAAKGLVSGVSSFISKNQEAISTAAPLIMKIASLMVALGLAGALFGRLGQAALGFVGVLNTVRKGIAGFSVAGALTNPVTLVIAAVAGLVAAFIVLWNRSEAFRTFWKNLFSQVKQTFLTAYQEIQPRIQQIGASFMQLYEASKPILELLGTVLGGVLTVALSLFVGGITGLCEALSPLLDAFSHLVNFVTNVVSAVTALFRGDFAGALGFAQAAVDEFVAFVTGGFNAITSFASGFASGFLDTVGGALSAVGIDASGSIAKIKSVVSSGMSFVQGRFASGMSAAGASVKQTLSNMVSAYQSAGGGIQGIAAAAMEGVKGKFDAGYAFINGATGGALDKLKGLFFSKLNKARETVTGFIDKVKGAFKFDWALPKIKLPHFKMDGKFSLNPPSVPSFDIKWYKKGGIMTRPTLFGAAGGSWLGGGEAGPEGIIPLNTLWDKLKEFIQASLPFGDGEPDPGHTPGEKGSKLQAAARIAMAAPPPKKQAEKGRKKEKQRPITVNINVDMGRIKDLDTLQSLIDELIDSRNGGGDPDGPVPA